MNSIKIIGIILSIILVVIIGLVIYFLYGSTVSPKHISIENINVTDSKINVEGIELDPNSIGTLQRWHLVTYNNEALFIQLKGGVPLKTLLPFAPIQETTHISISIPNKYGKIKEIYLRGDNPSENILIWPKK